MPTIFNNNAVLPVPAITTAQRDATPAGTLGTGALIVYNTDLSKFQFWQASNWLSLGTVVGPSSTIVGDIATWNDTTGTTLADSALNVSVVSSTKRLSGLGSIYLSSTTGLTAPVIANDGIFSANASYPYFTSGTTVNSGYLITGNLSTVSGNLVVNYSTPTFLSSEDPMAVPPISTTAFGIGAASSVTLGSSLNTFVGYNSGAAVTNGAGYSLFGASTVASVSLTNVTAIGYQATVTVSNALVLGNGAKVGIGKDAPVYALHLGTDHSMLPLIYMANTAVPSAPATANDGIYSVNGGQPTFKSGTTSYSGSLITGIYSLITGSGNLFAGPDCGNATLSGAANVGFAPRSGQSITTANDNTFVGWTAGFSLTSSEANTLIGKLAGPSISSGSGLNTCIGFRSGNSITTGDNITLLGANTDASATLTNATAIGANASVTASNCLVLGSSVNVGIGVSNPSYLFHIAGTRSTKSIVVTGIQSGGGIDNIGFLNDINLTSTSATTTALHQWIYPNFNATAGTITVGAGLLIDQGGNTGGTITNGYGLYVVNPAFGTNKCAIYGANASIGYTSITPPSSGLIVSGSTYIGASSATGTGAKFEVTTANSAYGLLHTEGTVRLSSFINNASASAGQIGTVTNHGLGFYVSNGAPVLNISTATNVGIGTQSAGAKFHVVASALGIADYGAVVFDTATSGGSGMTFGYDSSNNWSWIYSRTNGVAGRPLSLNNVLYVGAIGSGALSLGLSTFTTGKFVTAYDILPSSNKGKDIGSTSLRFNNIYYSSATTGTSRLAQSRTHCHSCDKPMMRGTGTTITLGEEADYIPVFCTGCGSHKVEALKHLPVEALSKRQAPKIIQFLGFKVCQYSGNSRGIQVLFKYDDDKENSTFLSDVEYDAFIQMDLDVRKQYLQELGLREWHALEEVRLMEAECESLQGQLDSMVKDFINEDIYTINA